MFTDPQTITINAIAKSCARVSAGDMNATYSTADADVKFAVSHQVAKKRVRRMVKLEQRKIAADPLTAVNAYQTASVHLVITEPEVGFTDSELTYLVDALKAWLTAGNVAKVLGSES